MLFLALNRELRLLLDEGINSADAAAILDLKDNPHRINDVWLEIDLDDRDLFLEILSAFVNDATFCADCEEPEFTDECTFIGDHGYVCDASCRDSYSFCEWCEEWMDNDDATVVGDTTYCQGCLSRRCSWCDECDEYYNDDYSDEHDHENSCECEAPRPTFTFPANGDGTVRQDERLEVTLPSGTISNVGLQEIRQAVYASSIGGGWPVAELINDLDPTWQKKDGNFTRRLSKAMYKELGIKIPPALLSEIGNIARRHTADVKAHHIEFTRNLNGSAEDFYHNDSCWWTSHSSSRCALKNWGGIGLRSFESDTHSWPNGRAWVQPLNENMEPTHNTVNPHAYVVYNGYGKMSGYTAARIVAHLTGRTYRRIDLKLEPQYVNGKVGYLVADQATCNDTGSVKFYADEHYTMDSTTIFETNQEVAA